MTFADLRALHAVIGAAIDDIERVYRPPPSLRRPSNPSNPQALTLSTSSTSSFHSARSSSIPRSSQSTDSDVEGEDDEDDDDDDDMPLTPVSASNAHLHSSIATISGPPNSVRFASTSKRTFGKGRERAHTMSSLPQPSFGSPGIIPPMPPPILKQPPLDFPSLDSPVFIPASPPSSRPSTDTSPSTPSQTGSVPTSPTSISHTTSMAAKVSSESENAGPSTAALGDPTLRQKEWKKKCEELATSSEVIKAVNKIVAACGQLTASVQKPFLSVCDAAMGYHLPSCLRFLEAAHIVEMLREAGSDGLHVSEIAKKIDVGLRLSRGEAETSDGPPSEQDAKGKGGVDANHLSHILRLLATHHITREVRPDVFANNRISSVIDSGKSWKELVEMSSSAERKYEGTDGIAAFVGMCTDELFKASAYLTDCYLSPPLPASPKQQSTSRSHKHEHSQSSIPPVPPLPTTAFTHRSRGSISEATSNAHRLGIYSPNDSRTSLASLPEDEREGKEEVVPNTMTFASNPLSASTKAGPGSTTPPTPTTTQRPGILKRLSSRSNMQVSSTPPPPMPETPRSPVLREAPETPRTRVPSMTSLLRQVQETPKSPAVLSTLRELVSTPRSTPNRQREETADVIEDETMRTPRSTPRRDSVASSIHSETDVKHATPRWTPSRESLRTLAKKGSFASLRARRQGGSGQLQISEPLAILPQPYEGTLVSDSNQGPLGPAFDLRPPAIVLSPRSTPSPKPPPSPTSAHIYGVDGFPPRSPAPPLPPKSALRGTPSASGLPSPVEPTFPRISPPPVGTASKVKKAKSAQKTNEMHAPFNVAFNTNLRFFDWLEKKENEFRLKRFGKAMTGTEKWEVPGSIIGGFPWHELPNRSVVVDVGGGIGSTSMLLANAFPQLRFVVQDRAPVAEMGRSAWRARCPELLDSGRAAFQAHDFFNVQPDLPPELDTGLALESESEVELEENGEQKLGTKVSGDAHASDASIIPAVFLMRVITHDWPDSYVTRILLRLRHAAGPNTKLVLADFVLPLACVDEDDDVDAADSELSRKKITRDPLPGTLRSLAPEGSPLLPNLGKANANAYWMDLTMRVMFNAQERTLRELAALTLSAGWKVVQVTRAEGSLFGHIVAVAVDIPPESLTLSELEEANSAPASPAQDATLDTGTMRSHMADTFLTYSDLPSEAAIREGVATGSIKLNAFKGAGKKRGRRERAYTFGGQRDTKDGKDNKGGEVRRGFRTLMKMLSKSQMKDTGAASADAAAGGQSKQRSRV